MRLTKIRLALLGSAVALSGGGGFAYLYVSDSFGLASTYLGKSVPVAASEHAEAGAAATPEGQPAHDGAAPAEQAHQSEAAPAGHDEAAADQPAEAESKSLEIVRPKTLEEERLEREAKKEEKSFFGGMMDSALGLVGLGGEEPKPAEQGAEGQAASEATAQASTEAAPAEAAPTEQVASEAQPAEAVAEGHSNENPAEATAAADQHVAAEPAQPDAHAAEQQPAETSHAEVKQEEAPPAEASAAEGQHAATEAVQADAHAAEQQPAETSHAEVKQEEASPAEASTAEGQRAAPEQAQAESQAAEQTPAETHPAETAAEGHSAELPAEASAAADQHADGQLAEAAAGEHADPAAAEAAQHAAAPAEETSFVGGVMDSVLGLVGLGGSTPEHADAGGKPGDESGKLRLEGVPDPHAKEETADAGHGDSGHGEKKKEGEGPPQVVMPDVYYEPRATQSLLIKGVRKLNNAQTAAAYGKREAGPSQKDALIELDSIIRKMDPKSLTQPDIDALAIYLLSGGRPEPAEELVPKLKLRKRNTDLVMGALAYVRGDKEGAKKGLGELNPEDFAPSLGTRIALAQSQLDDGATDDVKKQKLEFAALGMTGTLVEEAALRRLLSLAVNMQDQGSFLSVARKYQRHYAQSLYYNEFRRNLASGIFEFEKKTTHLNRNALRRILNERVHADNNAFLLDLTLQALRAGKGPLCGFLADVVSNSETGSDDEKLRARLYGTACTVNGDSQTALAVLKLIPESKLGATDQAIRTQIMNLLQETDVKELKAAEAPVEPPHPDEATKAHDNFMASVAQQLQATKEALERASQ